MLSYPDEIHDREKDLRYFALSAEYETPQYLSVAEREDARKYGNSFLAGEEGAESTPAAVAAGGGCGVMYFLSPTRSARAHRSEDGSHYSA
jgi:hypothetical protein